MNFSNKYFTIVFKNLTPDQRVPLVTHPAFSAGSWSHAIDDRDDALYVLSKVEEILTGITKDGDMNSVIHKDKIEQLLSSVRQELKNQGRLPRPNKSFKDVLNDNYAGII